MASEELIRRRKDFVKALREARARLDENYATARYENEVRKASKGLKRIVADLSGEATAALVLAIASEIPRLQSIGRESNEWRLLKDAARNMVGEF